LVTVPGHQFEPTADLIVFIIRLQEIFRTDFHHPISADQTGVPERLPTPTLYSLEI